MNELAMEITAIAEARSALHAHHASSRPLSKNYEIIGVAGEVAFARMFGLEVDKTLRPGGDGRIDFRMTVGTVDVKTAAKPWFLFCEKGKKMADIMVLGQFFDIETPVKLLGWEWGEEMVKIKPIESSRKIMNHQKHQSKLRRMEELVEMVKAAK